MKKLFCSSDVHGFYDEWMTALEKAGFDKENPNHIIVHCGDLIDRGHQPMKCLNFVNSLPAERKILICGNHELLMDDLIARKYPQLHDETNGTMPTIRDLTNIYGHDQSAIEDMQYCEAWKKYRKSLVWYAEVGNYIFVHSWIPCEERDKWGRFLGIEYNPDWRNSTARQFENATWGNPFECWQNGIVEEGKTITHGHWHNSFGHANIHNYGVEFVKPVETMHFDEETGRMWPFAEYGVFEDKGICSLDACTVVSHFVNCKVIKIKEKDWKEYAKKATIV